MTAGALRLLALLALIGVAWAAAPRSARADPADGNVFRQAAMSLGHQSRTSVTRWLDSQAAVQAARVGPDGKTLTIHFADGSRAVILPPVLRMTALPAAPRPLLRPHAQPAQTGGAAAIEPFATELGLSPDTFDPVVSYLRQAGFQVDTLYDSQVTLATMATIAQYNVVYVLSHSGVEDDGTGVLATAQETACKPYTSPDGTVQAVGVAGSSTCYFAITPAFISALPGHFPPDSIVFLNGCTLLTSHPFWVALANRGAGVMLSWNGDAQAQDDFLTAQDFFGEMQSGLSVSSAVSALPALGVGRSVYQGKLATFGYLGNGDITLKAAAAAVPPSVTPTLIPTDTPVPTHTPTPLPATPTDTPTATAMPTDTPAATATPMATLAPDVPSFSLHSIAVPGSRQEITVLRLASHSQGTLLVTYPSGSTVRQTQTADAGGTLHFIYIQQSAEITRKDHIAQVELQVQGRAGSAPSLLTGTYRITFAPVDVYVQQRHPSAGSTITVWTHSTVRKPVHVRIRSDGKTLHTAQTSGGHWSHFSYRLPAQLHRGVHLRVFARIGSGTGLNLATTRITIR